MSSILQKTLLISIKAYQATISPDHGLLRLVFPYGVCRFAPTCSHYTYQAIQQHGAYGLLIGLRRLLRCHPFTKV